MCPAWNVPLTGFLLELQMDLIYSVFRYIALQDCHLFNLVWTQLSLTFLSRSIAQLALWLSDMKALYNHFKIWKCRGCLTLDHPEIWCRWATYCVHIPSRKRYPRAVPPYRYSLTQNRSAWHITGEFGCRRKAYALSTGRGCCQGLYIKPRREYSNDHCIALKLGVRS